MPCAAPFIAFDVFAPCQIGSMPPAQPPSGLTEVDVLRHSSHRSIIPARFTAINADRTNTFKPSFERRRPRAALTELCANAARRHEPPASSPSRPDTTEGEDLALPIHRGGPQSWTSTGVTQCDRPSDRKSTSLPTEEDDTAKSDKHRPDAASDLTLDDGSISDSDMLSLIGTLSSQSPAVSASPAKPSSQLINGHVTPTTHAVPTAAALRRPPGSKSPSLMKTESSRPAPDPPSRSRIETTPPCPTDDPGAIVPLHPQIRALSQSHRLSTHFRTRSALDTGTQAAQKNTPLVLELYARLEGAVRDGEVLRLELGDLYGEETRVYAEWTGWKGARLFEAEVQALLCTRATDNMQKMVRLLGAFERDHGRRLWLMRLRSVWEAHWDDVEHVASILRNE